MGGFNVGNKSRRRTGYTYRRPPSGLRDSAIAETNADSAISGRARKGSKLERRSRAENPFIVRVGLYAQLPAYAAAIETTAC